jgi:hypothetical protein
VERENSPARETETENEKIFHHKIIKLYFLETRERSSLVGTRKFPLLHAYKVAEVGTRLTFALGQQLDEAIE